MKNHTLRVAISSVAALLICGVLQVMAENVVSLDPSMSMTAANPLTLLNPMTAIDPGTLRGFLDRPLFDPTRRPPPPLETIPVAPAPPAVRLQPPPNLQLLGVIHGSRDMAVARRAGEKKTIILHTGDDVGGWKVAILPPIGIRLQNGRRTFDYSLFGKSAVAKPTAAAEPER